MADAVTNMVKADLKRAEQISKLVKSALDKTIEARNELKDAIALCESDSYQDVRKYDKKDLEDLEAVLRVAATRPLNQLVSRWIDICFGRKGTVNAHVK